MDPADSTKGKSLAQNLNSQGPDSFTCSEVTHGSLADPGLGPWQNKVSQPAFPEVTRQLLPESVLSVGVGSRFGLYSLQSFEPSLEVFSEEEAGRLQH